MSRRGEIRHAGHVWKYSEGYSTYYDDKMCLVTWQFGDIHQCKIIAQYDGAKREHTAFKDPSVGFCLEPEATVRDAMDKLVRWARRIRNKEWLGPKELEEETTKIYSDIFPNHLAWVDHVFFVIGNGYEWFNGCIISSNIEDLEEGSFAWELYQKEEKERRERWAEEERQWGERMRELCEKIGEDYEQYKLNVYSKPKDPEEKKLYPVAENYSLVMCVPDDVRDDWLLAAYEAAQILASTPPEGHCQDPEHNIKMGKKALADLEARFGDRLPLTAPA